MRRALRAEVLLLVAVLGATGALAGYEPPGDADHGPATVVRTTGATTLRLTVDPARVGDNALRLGLTDPAGRPARGVRVVAARAVPPGRAGGSDVPVAVRLVPAGPGRLRAARVDLGTRGGWTVEVTLAGPGTPRRTVALPVRVR